MSRKLWSIAGGAALAAASAGAVFAALPDESGHVAQLIARRLPRTKVAHVDCAKIDGLCEVQAGSNLFYVDKSARYLVVGRVYDMETRQDLTAARLLEINPDTLIGGAASATRMAAGPSGDEAPITAGRGARQAVAQKVSLDALPRNGAIEWGGGGTTLTIFSDFRCGYCKLLHQQLSAMNVRVLERPISVLGTRLLSNAVMCADDRRKAVAMAYAGEELAADRRCDTTGLDANEKFAREHGFDGTPVIVRSDGAVIQGYRPKEFLERWLKGGAA